MKTLYALLLSCICCQYAHAQQNDIRPYTDNELRRWAQVCDWYAKALPQSFKGYSVKPDACAAYNWAENDNQGRHLTFVTAKNQPYGNNPWYNIYYSRNEDSVDREYQQIMFGMKDALNADGTYDMDKLNLIGDKEQKLNKGKTLHVEITTNVKADIDVDYHLNTKPEKLNLPIDAFACIYTCPEGKTLHSPGDGGKGLAHYMYKAIIIISSKAPKVENLPASDGDTIAQDKIYPADDASLISTAPVKNIAIEITGSEEDMRQLITLTDWKLLQSLIGK